MDYKPREIEKKWKKYWEEEKVYQVPNQSDRPKYYVLDMFPYPSGAGLHVGHPLGYIASDIFARYKRLQGFNVLHPMGYDSFGLPAEQYAVQMGVHPAKSTYENIQRFREQLDNLGFSYDWSREVATSDPEFYKWTQWIFLQLFGHYYDRAAEKAKPIDDLVAVFEKEGSAGVRAANSQDKPFSAAEWRAMSPKQKDDVLMNYRLAYRKITYVNWCEALGTVLANDEVKDGVSERGGHPVERRPMLQWSLRITAYAERLLNDLNDLDWSEAMKKMQSNWIGRSEGAQLFFEMDGFDDTIEIYTTRADTIFGATFMVLAPEHDLVARVTTPAQKDKIEAYLQYARSRSERERMAEVKEVTGEFTGAYAVNPFNGEKIPVWIADYVLKDYGTGAIMAVPADDERDRRFAEKFGLPIVEIIDKSMYPGATIEDKVGKMINSDFLNGLDVVDAIDDILQRIEDMGIGRRQVNYKLRDAIYSRQRYWGEPFPIVYDPDGVAHAMDTSDLPLELPELKDFKPTAGGQSPLARAEDWVNLPDGRTRETDTMPGFAGSSWYFLRYMDAHNEEAFAGQDAINYWRDVDLYIGGTEHAVGHLMYSRFWHKFLYDKGLVPTVEPFRRLVNQGMLQGVIPYAQIAHFVKEEDYDPKIHDKKTPFTSHILWISNDVKNDTEFFHPDYGMGRIVYDEENLIQRVVPLGFTRQIVDKDKTEFRLYKKDIEKMDSSNTPGASYFISVWEQTAKLVFWKTDDKGEKYISLYHEIGKMSKRYFNVVNPDEVVERYGADCFRMYEMFLGPIEQAKPWDTNGIDGVSKFLRRFWGLFFDDKGNWNVSNDAPTKEELKVLHTAIKKVNEDIGRLAFNTCVSAFMVVTNDLKKLNCNKQSVLSPLVTLVAPFAPHLAEELWHRLGQKGSVHAEGSFPEHKEEYLKEDAIEYPVAVNGKTRTTVSFPADAAREELEKQALEIEAIQKWIDGKKVKRVIVVPKRMINIVVG